MNGPRLGALTGNAGRVALWVAALPIRLICWVYQPDERDRAGIGEARIRHDAIERRVAWDRLQRDLAAKDGSRSTRRETDG